MKIHMRKRQCVDTVDNGRKLRLRNLCKVGPKSDGTDMSKNMTGWVLSNLENSLFRDMRAFTDRYRYWLHKLGQPG